MLCATIEIHPHSRKEESAGEDLENAGQQGTGVLNKTCVALREEPRPIVRRTRSEESEEPYFRRETQAMPPDMMSWSRIPRAVFMH